jgi:twinkle protein
MWAARTTRPDGIVDTQDLWESVNEVDEQSTAQYPWEFLNEKLYGLRKAELVMITSGSGLGKSAVVREIAYDLLKQGRTIGAVFLEETVKRTTLGLMGLAANLPLHLPDGRAKADDAVMKAAFDATAGTGRLFLFDHFGSTDPEVLYSKIKYLVKGCGADVILLDHLSMMASGSDDKDERKLLDNIMTELRVLAQQLSVIFVVVSHLKRPMGQGHEDGARTSLSQLRGSAAIAQLSDQVIGLERNQQCETNGNITTVRVLKNRFSGVTGIAGYLAYNQTTGRLVSCPAPVEAGPATEGTAQSYEF